MCGAENGNELRRQSQTTKYVVVQLSQMACTGTHFVVGGVVLNSEYSIFKLFIQSCPPFVCRRSPRGIEAAEDHGGEAVQPLCVGRRDEQRGAPSAGRLSRSEHLHAEDPRGHPQGWRETNSTVYKQNIVRTNDLMLFSCPRTGLHDGLQPETAGFGRETQLPHL